MATLQWTVKGEFTATDAVQMITTRRQNDPAKFDVRVIFRVEDGAGNERATWPQDALDVDPLDVPSWFTPAFRAAAWAAYKASINATEV